MDQDAAVKALYERFPYPPPIEDMTPFVTGGKSATFNPRDSWSLYFPDEPKRGDLDILVAGCGTRAAVMMAACMPEARVLAIDISARSIAVSEETAARGGLTNLEHQLLPLEEVASLGRDFDLVHCHGVLHHLADPTAGLRALGTVLRPRGAMSLMVYARFGRAGVYMLQDLGQALGLSVDEETARDLQEMAQRLPDGHPFRSEDKDPAKPLPIPEVMDLFMHPRDVSYDVAGVRALVADSGMRFHRWIGQAPYRVSCSPFAGSAIGNRVGRLDMWGQSSAMELLLGTITTHDFVVTHPDRPTAEELFEGERLMDACPSQAAHVGFEEDGDLATVFSRAHRRGRPAITENKAAVGALFGAFDGESTIREILKAETRVAPNPDLEAWLPRICRQLYEADVLALSVTPPS
jgi:SAM-dependent methyltransferase